MAASIGNAFAIALIIGCAVSSQQTELHRVRRQFDNIFGVFNMRQSTPNPPTDLAIGPVVNPQTDSTTPTSASTTPSSNNQLVFINNRPTVATVPPFIAPTTPTPQFMRCFQSCPTTSEYNPICASNQQLYFNEQKFNCAVRCGADIQIVRRGSCEGLFAMQRG